MMACFHCRVTGEKRCDGSCGLGCVDCPGFEREVEPAAGEALNSSSMEDNCDDSRSED